MDTTQLHIQNWQTFLMGQPRLLPNGGESYEIIFDEMAQIIANNMQQATKCVGGNWDNYEFHHCINIDRGTLANPDTVRNVLVYKIKSKLGMLSIDEVYHNRTTGRSYDFKEYYVRLSQELYHLVIRCRGIWNYSHSDCWAVVRGLTNVTKRLQWKYDKYKHASVLETPKGDMKLLSPYELYESLDLLTNDKTFKIIRDIILWYLQLQGTTNTLLQRQLNYKINSAKLWDDEGRTARQIVADLLYFLYHKVTDNHSGHIESVKFSFDFVIFLYISPNFVSKNVICFLSMLFEKQKNT